MCHKKYLSHLIYIHSFLTAHRNQRGSIESFPILVTHHLTGYISTNNNEKVNKTQSKHFHRKRKKKRRETQSKHTAHEAIVSILSVVLLSRLFHCVCVCEIDVTISIHIKLICIEQWIKKKQNRNRAGHTPFVYPHRQQYIHTHTHVGTKHTRDKKDYNYLTHIISSIILLCLIDM